MLIQRVKTEICRSIYTYVSMTHDIIIDHSTTLLRAMGNIFFSQKINFDVFSRIFFYSLLSILS